MFLRRNEEQSSSWEKAISNTALAPVLQEMALLLEQKVLKTTLTVYEFFEVEFHCPREEIDSPLPTSGITKAKALLLPGKK
jgi:hypothetical protein